MQIRGVLFDWGGTLAHVDGQVEALARGASEVLAILTGQADQDLVRSMMTTAVQAEQRASADPEFREVQVPDLLRDWAADHGIPIGDGQLERAVDAIGRNWVGSALTPVEGVRETLQVLRSMGLPLGLVSNCFLPLPHCLAELRHQGLSDLLDCAIFSSAVGYRKPSRHIYAEALRQLTAAGGPDQYDQILFVGDSPAYDVIMPASLGMSTALIDGNSSLWAAEDYERARPDFRVNSVTELPALLADLS